MRTKVVVISFIALLAVISMGVMSASAADISGKWTAPATSPSGSPMGDRIFTFKVSGDKLTGEVITQQTSNATFDVEGKSKMVGKLTTQSGSPVEITEGKIIGNEVSFVTVNKMGQMEMKTTYKGTIVGNEIKFISEMQMPAGGMPSMGGPSPSQGTSSSSQGGQQQGPKPQEFVAKRMNK
jgi:hypothetical protein